SPHQLEDCRAHAEASARGQKDEGAGPIRLAEEAALERDGAAERVAAGDPRAPTERPHGPRAERGELGDPLERGALAPPAARRVEEEDLAIAERFGERREVARAVARAVKEQERRAAAGF